MKAIENQQTQHIQEDDISSEKIKRFIDLEQETRPIIPTNNSAYYLFKSPQTLRSWACLENGPIRPIRIHGRLFWPTAEIKKLVNGGV